MDLAVSNAATGARIGDVPGPMSANDGYDALQEMDRDHDRPSHGNVGCLDLILEAEGDSTKADMYGAPALV